MPLDLAPEPEFSYEQNVAPYANRFFGEIESNSQLSRQAKTRLQGTLLSGVDEIEKQRLAIQEERDKGRMRSLQYAEGVSALEDARAKRLRISQVDEETKATAQRIRQVTLDPNMTAEEKQLVLGDMELSHPFVGDSAIHDIFSIGRKALPESTRKTDLTPTQVAKYVADGVPPEVVAFGDPYLIGQFAQKAAERDLQLKKDEEKLSQGTHEAESLKRSLLTKDLSFERDETTKEESPWMKPESTRDAERIIMLGTPEEQKRFAELKNASSDTERYRLVTAIQRRELAKKLQAAESKGSPKSTAASLIGNVR